MLAIVTDLINPDRVRGRSLVVPRWWLDAAKAAAEASGLIASALGNSYQA